VLLASAADAADAAEAEVEVEVQVEASTIGDDRVIVAAESVLVLM
jgi:hypothetical protein